MSKCTYGLDSGTKSETTDRRSERAFQTVWRKTLEVFARRRKRDGSDPLGRENGVKKDRVQRGLTVLVSVSMWPVYLVAFFRAS
jgi:hypothetical protein